MNLKMTPDSGPSGGGSRFSKKVILAMASAGILGAIAVTWAVSKAFEDPKAKKAALNQPTMTADEQKMALKSENAKEKGERDGEKIKQADIGSGVQYDAQGNMIPTYQAENARDPSGVTNMALDQLKSQNDRQAISAGIQRPSSSKGSEEPVGDPSVMRERREAKKEEKQEVSAPMLGYTTSKSATWAVIKPNMQAETAKGHAKPVSDEEKIAENENAISKLTALAEQAINQPESGPAVSVNVAGGGGSGSTAGRVMPAQIATQVAEPGAIADMRVATGINTSMIVREGKFLDCALVNRVESDINDSPVILQVVRDFVSPDGRYVLIPAGSKIYGVAGSVQSIQQARLYISFHRIVFPTKRGENESLSAYFPKRRFPAMDNYGSLGVKDQLNRHLWLQFGAAIFLGVFDGMAAQVQTSGSGDNPIARDLILAQASQNFSNVVNNVMQRYANVVPTVTIREGKKIKVYFTQDVRLTPWMETKNLSWVSGG